MDGHWGSAMLSLNDRLITIKLLNMDPNYEEFFEFYFAELTKDILSNNVLKLFTKNSAIIGAFAEKTVRQFISNFFDDRNVSTGTIITKKHFKTQQKLNNLTQ
jgi:hypothetical protein